GRRPVLLLNRAAPGLKEAAQWFEPGPVDSPPLLQAQAIDLDLDGWTDIVALSDERRPVFLHNEASQRRGLIHVAEALGPDKEWPRDLVAITVADFDGDGFADVMVWSESQGLQLHHNRGNANYALPLELTGRRAVEPNGSKVRCNADGFGTWV